MKLRFVDANQIVTASGRSKSPLPYRQRASRCASREWRLCAQQSLPKRQRVTTPVRRPSESATTHNSYDHSTRSHGLSRFVGGSGRERETFQPLTAARHTHTRMSLSRQGRSHAPVRLRRHHRQIPSIGGSRTERGAKAAIARRSRRLPINGDCARTAGLGPSPDAQSAEGRGVGQARARSTTISSPCEAATKGNVANSSPSTIRATREFIIRHFGSLLLGWQSNVRRSRAT